MRVVSVVFVVVSVLSASVAAAQPKPPPWILAPGKVRATATVEMDASQGKFAKPVSLAPDIAVGVHPRLTLELGHSTFFVTGFRGAAGRGLCLTGDDKGCAKLYNNLGAEATFAAITGPISVAANVGFHAINLDAGFYAAKIGAKARAAHGAWIFTSMPSVFIAATHRDGQKDTLWVPVAANLRVRKDLLVGVGSGVKGPLDGFSTAWEVPVGFSTTWNPLPALGVGASWVFGKLLGGAEDPAAPAPPATGVRYRVVHAWVSYTL